MIERESQLYVAYLCTCRHVQFIQYTSLLVCMLCVLCWSLYCTCVSVSLQMAGLKLKLEDAEQLIQECKVQATQRCASVQQRTLLPPQL